MKRLALILLFLVGMVMLFADESTPPEIPTPLHCYPSPFNTQLTINYSPLYGDVNHPVTIQVYNILGELVKTIWDAPIQGNTVQFVWHGDAADGRLCANGVYLISVRSSSGAWVQKALMLK